MEEICIFNDWRVKSNEEYVMFDKLLEEKEREKRDKNFFLGRVVSCEDKNYNKVINIIW